MVKTIKDLSDLTGISTSTISRVLSNHGYVDETTRKIVRKAVEDSGYVYKPTINKRNSVDLVMLVMCESANNIYGTNIRGMRSVFDEHGIMCVGTFGDRDQAEKQEYYIRHAIRNRFKGLIILSPIETPAFKKMMQNCAVPTVLLNRHMESIDVDEVCMNNVSAGMLAVNYLIKKGHTRIAHMGVPANSAGSYRMKGYLRAMQAAGLEVRDSDILKGDNTYESAVRQGSLIAEERGLITAVYAANETLSVGLIEGIRRSGLRVPEDISIVSTDNTLTSLMSTPQLTTVSCDYFKVGVEAANLFIERCANPLAPRRKIFFEPEIIERASVRDINPG